MIQDWGHVTVRPKAHMFWWLYYTEESLNPRDNNYEKPLVIWLQGGPGESATGIGNFVLIGPEDIYSLPRKHTWVILRFQTVFQLTNIFIHFSYF